VNFSFQARKLLEVCDPRNRGLTLMCCGVLGGFNAIARILAMDMQDCPCGAVRVEGTDIKDTA
jgi:hypothetical protein